MQGSRNLTLPHGCTHKGNFISVAFLMCVVPRHETIVSLSPPCQSISYLHSATGSLYRFVLLNRAIFDDLLLKMSLADDTDTTDESFVEDLDIIEEGLKAFKVINPNKLLYFLLPF